MARPKIVLEVGQVWKNRSGFGHGRMVLQLSGLNVMYIYPNEEGMEDWYAPAICRVANFKRWISENRAEMDRVVEPEFVRAVIAKQAETAMSGPVYRMRLRVLVADLSNSLERILGVEAAVKAIEADEDGEFILYWAREHLKMGLAENRKDDREEELEEEYEAEHGP